MFVIIKSPPDSKDAEKGVAIARDEAADILLVRDGVYLARKGMLDGFCGTAFAFDEDIRLRGISESEMEPGVKEISCKELIDLLARTEKITGPF